jgi:hypothetical protein
MKVIDSWETNDNFWVSNVQFKVAQPFKSLYDSDKSKNKEASSKIMWGLAFMCDFGSKYRQLSVNERKELIARDIFKNPNFNWDDYKDYIRGWEIFKTSAERQMMQWERFINEKTEFLETLKYDKENSGLIEKLLLSNSDLYEEYEDIMARLSQEEDGGTMKGGSMESASERGDI